MTSRPLFNEQTFASGLEDLEVDVSEVVEQWLKGDIQNYGFGVFLSSSYEAYFSGSAGADSGSVLNNLAGAKKSYYTKRFFARGSQYFSKDQLSKLVGMMLGATIEENFTSVAR